MFHRREKSLPVIKRKILGSLVDFAASELHLQVRDPEYMPSLLFILYPKFLYLFILPLILCLSFTKCYLTIMYVTEEQTQVVAAAAANVAAEGLSPRTARVEAEAAASLSMSLAENALVLLMLVEDHLRLESQYYYSTISLKSALGSGPILPALSNVPSRRHSAIGIEISLPSSDKTNSRRLSTTPDTGGLSLEVCGSCLPIMIE